MHRFHFRRLGSAAARRLLGLPIFVGVLVGQGVPALAYGPNLLANPTFDTGTTGWTLVSGAPLAWEDDDAHGSPLSGSLSRIISPGHYNSRAAQCVAVVAGSSYVFGSSVWIDPDAPATADSQIVVSFFDDAACTGDAVGSVSGDHTPHLGGWQRIGGRVVAPTGAGSAQILVGSFRNTPVAVGAVRSYFDEIFFGTGRCAPGPTTLCLHDGRFRVESAWTTAEGSGDGMAIPFKADSGGFWFFDPDNVEMDVKVLDGCAVNGHYWVFAAGLTSAQVSWSVTDLEADVTHSFFNPLDVVFEPVQETELFATCP